MTGASHSNYARKGHENIGYTGESTYHKRRAWEYRVQRGKYVPQETWAWRTATPPGSRGLVSSQASSACHSQTCRNLQRIPQRIPSRQWTCSQKHQFINLTLQSDEIILFIFEYLQFVRDVNIIYCTGTWKITATYIAISKRNVDANLTFNWGWLLEFERIAVIVRTETHIQTGVQAPINNCSTHRTHRWWRQSQRGRR